MTNSSFVFGAAYVAVLFFFTGCLSNNTDSNSERNFRLNQEIISIDHDSVLLTNKPAFYNVTGYDSLIYFEASQNSLFLLDFKNNSINKRLQFESAGPNFLENNVLDLATVDDLYFILTQNYLSVVNSESQITNRIKINNIDGSVNTSDYRVHRINAISLDSVLISKWILADLYANTVDSPLTSIFGNLQVPSEQITDIPVYSPQETLVTDPEVSYFGLSERYFITKGCELIFNYRFSSSIFKYNLCSKVLTKYPAKSDQLPNLKKPLKSELKKDPRALYNFISNGVSFSNIEYMNELDVYVRLVSIYNLNDELVSSSEKYIQILDREFNILKEEKLNRVVKDHLDVLKNHIYLQPSQQDEDVTRFLRVSLVKD